MLTIAFEAEKDSAGYVAADDRIVRRGGALETLRPLEFHATLYAQFAQLDDRPEALADFMTLFGPLTHDGHYLGENVAGLVARRLWMQRAIELSRSDPSALLQLYSLSDQRARAIGRTWFQALEKALGRKAISREKEPIHVSAAATMTATLQPGLPDGRPTLCLAADTLWDAMQLQFYQTITTGARLRSCEWCTTWFKVGGHSGRPVDRGRRVDARFCSDACRMRAHAEKTKGLKP